MPKVTWLVNVRTGNRIHFPVFQPRSAFSLHYLQHSINWLENKTAMSLKLFFPWAQKINDGCAHVCDGKQHSLSGITGPWLIVSAKAFYNSRKKKMREERTLPFLVLTIFCLSLRLCLLPKREPSKVHSPNNPNYLPYFLSAAFGICYLSSCSQGGCIELGWVLAVKGGLGYKGPILSVIQWGQVSACLICL